MQGGREKTGQGEKILPCYSKTDLPVDELPGLSGVKVRKDTYTYTQSSTVAVLTLRCIVLGGMQAWVWVCGKFNVVFISIRINAHR